MNAAAVPPSEAERLRALRRYQILDTPPDGAFDRIARLAARYFNVPIATVSIVDHDRIWFKATHGVDVAETDRTPGLCASAILQPDPYIITDAITDPRSLDNPLVRGELGVRFYAAAPIRTRDGYNLGTVNVIAGRPREITDNEVITLQELADVAADELELRLSARRAVELERERREDSERLTGLLETWLLPQRVPEVPGVDIATHYEPASPELHIGGDFLDVFELADGACVLIIGDVCGKGPWAAAATGEIRQMLRAFVRVESAPSRVLARLNDVLTQEGFNADRAGDASERFCTAGLARLEADGTGIQLTAAFGGHPLALVRRASGEVETMGAPGDLVGAFAGAQATDEQVRLEPGDLLLLYTDGAVEQHGQSIAVGERTLRRALESAPVTTAADAAAHLRQAVNQSESPRRDDVALLVARITEGEATQ